MRNRLILLICFMLKILFLNASNMSSTDSLFIETKRCAEIAYYQEADDTLACKYAELAIRHYERMGRIDSVECARWLSLWCQYGCDVYRTDAILVGEYALGTLKEFAQPHEYAECLSSLAYCYSLTEDSLNLNSKKSLKYCLEALKNINIIDHGEIYASILSNLSGAYISNGEYHKALETAEKCNNFVDSCLNNTSIKEQTILYAKYCNAYSLALHNKALALHCQGKYIDCLTWSKKNIQFRLDLWGVTGRYAQSIFNLAMIEEDLGLYADAYNHYWVYLTVLQELNQLTIVDEIEIYCHIIDIHIQQGQLFNARPIMGYLSSLVEKMKSDIEQNPELYGMWWNTSIKYWLHVGDLHNAYYYLDVSHQYNIYNYIEDDIRVQMYINSGQDSLSYIVANGLQSFYEEEYGFSDIRSIQNLTNIVKSAIAIDNWNIADSCAKCYLYGIRKHIGQMLPLMSTEDRESFLKKISNSLFEYIPYVLNSTRRNGFEKSMYDLILLHKGILLRTEIELSNLVKQSNNIEALDLYYEISDNTARLKNVKYQYERDSISNILQYQMMSLQKLIPTFSEIIGQFDISWYDIKNNLKNDEIAIEFLDIIDHNTGNKSCKALVIKNDWDSPYYVDLFNETDLYNIDKNDYYTTPYLYTLIWDPICARILQYEDSIKKVYFSPSDMISQIAIESLIDYNKKNISESREFFRLSSTRELVKRDKKNIINKAVIYGGLKYDAEIKDLIEINKQNNVENAKINRSNSVFINDKRAGLRYLPGTRIEAELIESELNHKGIQRIILKGINGTEESFYALNNSGVNILHIATHGFYWSQSEYDSLQAKRAISMSHFGLNMNQSDEDKALTRSGLFFSGANVALGGQMLSENICDGILTAQEISKLDLGNLDLAVLSACETGLGDIKSGEGVFGLQRGFKKAGVNSILMSLWKVDDDATQKLMVEFYKNLLNGETKTNSLSKAQQYVKSQKGFEDPEYWAGFVLLDGLI